MSRRNSPKRGRRTKREPNTKAKLMREALARAESEQARLEKRRALEKADLENRRNTCR